MAVVRLAYRFALDPSPAQERSLRSHAGAARFAWNWGLAKCKERYAAERKWYSVGRTCTSCGTRPRRPTRPCLVGGELQVRLPGILPEPGAGAARLRQVQEGRAEGEAARVPQVQETRQVPGLLPVLHWDDPLRGATVDPAPPRRHPHLRVHPEAGPQAGERHAPHLVGHGLAHAQRWFVSFTVEVDRALRCVTPGPVSHRRRPRRPGRCSPASMTRVRDRRLRPAAASVLAAPAAAGSRARIPASSTGSANRRKSAGRLARIHARVANIRTDALHKATSELVSPL